MGSKKSTGGGGTSPGESQARVGTTEITGTKNAEKAQIKVIGKRADNKAREKLNIQKIGDAGYRSLNNPYGDTTQMYGAAYNQARGEYLSSLGLARRREVTDAMGKKSITYDPRTASGTYNNLSRGSMNEAKAYKTPLSKEMYDSQQKFKAGIGVVAGFMGAPLIPSLMFKSAATPYSTYVNQTREQGFYNFSTTQTSPIDDVKNVMSKVKEEFADKTKSQKQQKYLAKSGMTSTDKGRNLLNTTGSTFSK